MRLSFRLNGKQIETDVKPDMLLLDLVRELGCYSVKRGCETANCGLCTVLMNKKCEELGLKNTHFVNSTGLYDDEQYTTPSEMAMIMKYAMENSECAKVLSTFQYTTEKTTQHPDGILLTNTMFSRMYGTEVEGVTITAGKTGYTDEALNCLVSYAVKGDKSYICVTSHAHNKWHCVFDSFEIYGNYLP